MGCGGSKVCVAADFNNKTVFNNNNNNNNNIVVNSNKSHGITNTGELEEKPSFIDTDQFLSITYEEAAKQVYNTIYFLFIFLPRSGMWFSFN